MLIRTFAYHFAVRYIPGITNQLVDCLSCLGRQKDTIKLPKLHIYQITNQLSARSDSLNQIRIATQEDDELALFKHTITQGWPSTIRVVPSEIQPYWTFREELTVEHGIILEGTQIILQGRNAKSDFPMSNAASKQLGIQPEVIRNINKHEVLPTHDLHIEQNVSTRRMWQSSGTQVLSQAYFKKR